MKERIWGIIKVLIILFFFVNIIYNKYNNKSINDNKSNNKRVEIQLKDNKEKFDIKKVNILISGSDSRKGKIVSKSRSDVNMILSINPSTHKILLTSIPRDYYVQLHGTKGNKDKLTHAGIYGIDMSKQTLEDLFNIKIDYTIKVGFNSLIELVDLIDGIDVDSDITFNSSSIKGWTVNKGINHFNGKQALAYSRERYAYKNGDIHRIQNQQQVLEAIMNKMFNNKSLLLRYNKLLESLSNLYVTDIPNSYIKLIVKEQLTNMESWDIEKQYLKGNNSKKETYSMPGIKLYVMVPDNNSVKSASNNINLLLNEN